MGRSVCGETCKAMRAAWAPILDNPLASFVLGTWAIQMIIICACVYAIMGASDGCNQIINEGIANEDTSDEDSAESAVMMFCVLEIAFAVIHMFFAFYIQRRLVTKLNSEEESTTMSQVVWYLLKYDIGFCLYFFFAIAAPSYALYATSAVGKCDSTESAQGTGAAIFMACAYGVLEFFYMCCFVCGAGAKAKVGDVKIHRGEGKDEAKAPAEITGPAAV